MEATSFLEFIFYAKTKFKTDLAGNLAHGLQTVYSCATARDFHPVPLSAVLKNKQPKQQLFHCKNRSLKYALQCQSKK